MLSFLPTIAPILHLLLVTTSSKEKLSEGVTWRKIEVLSGSFLFPLIQLLVSAAILFTTNNKNYTNTTINQVQLGLPHTHVWWQIEISQFLAFFSTHIFTLQQLLEDPVKILFHIPNPYPHFWGGSQKCTHSTPL